MKAFFLIVSMFAINSYWAHADDDDDKALTEAIKTPLNGVVLSVESQIRAGIDVQTLESAQFQNEIMVTGKALSVQPLLALRSRYLLNTTEQNSAKTKWQHANQNLQRLQSLYQQGVAAKRLLQAEQTQQQTEQAILEATRIQNQALKDEAQLLWGSVLGEWIVSPDHAKLKAFLSGKQTLLLINLPPHQTWQEASTLAVSTSGQRDKAQMATLISAAPPPENSVSGNYYFAQTDGRTIKPGMKVSVWLPSSQIQSGVIIPGSALVWHLNQACVYIKTSQETYQRQALTYYTPVSGDYFVNDTLKPGQQIVTRGAQVLLSEEARGQIPDD